MNSTVSNIIQQGLGESYLNNKNIFKKQNSRKNYKPFYESIVISKDMGIFLKNNSLQHTINNGIRAFSEDEKKSKRSYFKSLKTLISLLYKFIKKIISFIMKHMEVIDRVINAVEKLQRVLPKLKDVKVNSLEISREDGVSLPDFEIMGFKIKTWGASVVKLYRNLDSDNSDVDAKAPDLKETLKFNLSGFFDNGELGLGDISTTFSDIRSAREKAKEKLETMKSDIENGNYNDEDKEKLEQKYKFMNLNFNAVFDGEKEVLKDIDYIFKNVSEAVNIVLKKYKESKQETSK